MNWLLKSYSFQFTKFSLWLQELRAVESLELNMSSDRVGRSPLMSGKPCGHGE